MSDKADKDSEPTGTGGPQRTPAEKQALGKAAFPAIPNDQKDISEQKEPWWVSRAEAISKWATTVAIVGTGVWAVFHFYIAREGQTAVTIDIVSSSIPYNNNGTYLVTFDVTLANNGHVAIRANREIRPAYTDKDEVVLYGGDLLVRRISDQLKSGDMVAWFVDDHEKSPKRADLESDLLRIFRADDGTTDFWIEPGEAYHLTSSFVLEAGTYLAIVTFVSDRSSEDLWRRVAVVSVPVQATSNVSQSTVDTMHP
ncbi:MAG TPA: hypothetical protein VGI60_07970 [Chthoniobacterales bacterium]|jgi:hypothetical protein